MEAISITVAGLATVFYNSMFHFLVHVGGSTVIQKFQGYLNTVRIKNHDVDRAIHDSYKYTLSELQRKCSGESQNTKKSNIYKLEQVVGIVKRLTKVTKEPFKEEFGKLYGLVTDMSHSLDKNTPPPEIQISLPDLMTCEEPGIQLATMIIDKAGITNKEFREFFIKSFPDLFLFAFKEIGLKNRPKVNIVLTNEVLCKIYNEVKEKHTELKAFTEDLRTNIQLVQDKQVEFQANLDKKLADISAALSDIQQSTLKKDAFIGSFGPIRGFLLLSIEGRGIGFYPCNSPIVTVGRALTNMIILQGTKISRNHVQIYFKENGIVIQDTSSNGTSLNNLALKKNEMTPVNWGDIIKIESYEIELSLNIQEQIEQTFIPTI